MSKHLILGAFCVAFLVGCSRPYEWITTTSRPIQCRAKCERISFGEGKAIYEFKTDQIGSIKVIRDRADDIDLSSCRVGKDACVRYEIKYYDLPANPPEGQTRSTWTPCQEYTVIGARLIEDNEQCYEGPSQ